MKPLHIGLLMVGAAIAGGLAVRMTQPLAFPPPPVKAAATNMAPGNVAPSTTPPAETTIPIPPAAETVPPVKYVAVAVPDASTSAPPPVFTEPHTHTRPTPFPVPPKQQPAQIAMAKAPQLPGLYQRPSDVSPVQDADESQPPHHVTLEPGTTIAARVMETLSSDRVSAGDTFSATLAEPLVIDGLIIAERGARVDGRVVNAQRPARVNGHSAIQLALSNITTADGQRIPISTEPWLKTGAGSGSTQAGEIGGGAVLGAIIGAIADGGKGAAIGAGIGGIAGAGTAAATRAQPVTVPTETVIRFRVKTRVTITERQL